jgi:glycosyltransferase involved in cell wall biosynthesis
MLFTVFTPTFNRANTLNRVYESLCHQTLQSFEWLIIDDGSTDNTKEIVSRWQEQASFPIRYIWQPNGHKKTAFNHAVRLAQGALFLTADSDDRFVTNALERLSWHWFNIPQDLREQFAGVCGLCQSESGQIIGDRFPGDWGVDSDSLETRYRFRVHGEKWGFTRTDLLRTHPFPQQLPGHVPEGVVWSTIAATHKTRFINEALRIYFQGGDDQLTQHSDPATNAPGTLYWKRIILETDIQWFRYAPLAFAIDAARWTRFRLHLNTQSMRSTEFMPKNLLGKALIVLMSPAGFIWWLRDQIVAKKKNYRHNP